MTVLAPRRWGKTEGIIRYACRLADRLSARRIAYIGQEKQKAQSLVFEMFDDLNDVKKFRAKKNQQKGFIRWRNRSILSIHGTDKPKSMRMLRGFKFDLIIVDEAQDFCYINVDELINRVLIPCLQDRRGRIFMAGTPGEESRGYFYECMVEKIHTMWHTVQGKQFENPWTAAQALEDEETYKLANPNVEEEAWFLREHRGIWVPDVRNNVVRLRDSINFLHSWTPKSGDKYFLGIDWGFTDPSAYVLACIPEGCEYFLYLEAYTRDQMLLHDHLEKLAEYTARYPGITIVADPGGSGKALLVEMQKNGYNIENAEKKEKRHFVETVNSEASLGLIKVYNLANPSRPKESPIAIQWSELVRKRNPRTGEWEEGKPRHIHDGAIYARRRALIEKAPENDKKSWGEVQAEKIREDARRRAKGLKRRRDRMRPWQ